MQRYQVSNSPDGPWLELIETGNPAHALEKARAVMDWKVVWVARMRPLWGSDLLPSAEVLHGEVIERIMTRHGSQIADQLNTEVDWERLYVYLSDTATNHLIDVESECMVPDIKKPYGRDQAVRPNDFDQAKPKLADLM